MKRLILPFCLLAQPALADVPNVVTDIVPVGGIVARIMDGVGKPTVLVPLATSPHDYALRPSDAKAMSEADLAIWVGPELTPFVEDLEKLLPDRAEVMPLLGKHGSSLLDIREGMEHDHHDHGHDDHGDGHDDHDDHGEEHADHDDHGDEHHGEEEHHKDDDHHDHKDGHDDDHGADKAHDDHHEGADPHAWLDPQNAILWANEIAHELGHLDPDNAVTYEENRRAFENEVNALQAELQAKLEPVSSRKFVVLHDAMQYFETRFGLQAEAAIYEYDGQSPSPAKLRDLEAQLGEVDVACILVEPQLDPKMLNALNSLQSIRLYDVNLLGDANAELAGQYPALIRNLGETLVTCLSGAE